MHNQNAYDRLKARLFVDITRIDDELIENPGMIQEAYENTAYAMQLRDEAKRELEEEIAKAGDEMRRQTRNGKPPSEASIKAEVPLDKAVQERQAVYSARALDAALWNSVVEGFKTKTSSIKHTAELIVAGYLTPSAIRDKARDDLRQGRERRRLQRD